MTTQTHLPQGGHVLDLSIGESVEVKLGDDAPRRITLDAVDEPRCAARGTIRFPKATVDVDGEKAEVPAALYHMPQVVNGIRVACSVTRGVAEAVGSRRNVYALDKDARIRCWQLDGPLFGLKPLVYPAKQRWFASMTQMANERTYVDGGELPAPNPDGYVYHHYGLDLGGYDKAVPVVAPVDGRVVCLGEEAVADYDASAGGDPRYDRIAILDEAGWYYRYSHLDTLARTIGLGDHVQAGAYVGALGKEGASGGWSHLHFSLCSPQPSGRYGEVEGYPFLVEAYLHEHPGSLLACARPHLVATVGEEVELDGSRSICDGATIGAFRWTLHDGEIVDDVRATKVYSSEGMYSEMLTVTDSRGETDVDFCVMQVLSPDADPAKTPPSMHVAHYPTEGIRPGQPIAFKARAFFKGAFDVNMAGEESWDFGDGTEATTCSGAPGRGSACSDLDYDERWHAYEEPGRYIVTVRRTGKNGLTATAQVKVHVEDQR